MKNINNWIIITVGGIIVLVLISLISRTIHRPEDTDEGKLMAAACKDIIEYEELGAEAKFEKIHDLITSHTHNYLHRSDSIISVAIKDLDSLKDEVMFHNVDLSLYHTHFSYILLQLSYVEIEDALGYLMSGDLKESRNALNEARHYFHDALVFDKEDPEYEKKVNMIHQLDDIIKSNFTEQDVRAYLVKYKILMNQQKI